MSGLEQILDAIREQTEEKIHEIEEESADRIAAADRKAKQETARECEEILTHTEKQCDRDLENAAVAAKTAVNRAVLHAKVDVIDQTVAEALAAIHSLPDEEYAAILCRKIARAAENHGGTVFLAATDQKRLPADFEQNIAALLPAGVTVTVSDEPAAIGDGFILRYGDIEENGSFDAVAEAERDRIKDAVAAVLFG